MHELFANFEVGREPRWPLLLRLLLGSVILHGAMAATVVYVPTVRDAFNIAALAGKAGYVDKAYSKTAIGEDMQLLDLAKFHYPPGYFALESTGNQSQGATDPFAPKIILQASALKPEPSPTPSPQPVASPSPALASAATPSSSPTAGNDSATAKTEDAKKNAEVDKELDKIAADNNVLRPDEDEINKRPLKDWLAAANALREKGQLDLSQAVEISIEAKLQPDCRLGDAVVVQKSGDARLADVAKDMVAAISDSNMLSFLKDPDKHKGEKAMPCEAGPLRMTVKLDAGAVSAQVASEADSIDRAAQLARAYNSLLLIGQALKRGHDEEEIYKNTKVSADGKQITVQFNMSRQTAAEMLKKQLDAKPSG